ncbi:MAG: hypothetical protein OXR62_09200 [Ahrensia sp.]|nr:hypothetical protein [Ahrensia sp.]
MSAQSLFSAVLWPLLWALIISTSLVWHLIAKGWAWDIHLFWATGPYALGALVGGAFGRSFATQLTSHKAAKARFCAFFAANALTTLAFAALFYFLPQRAYFAQWHADIFELQWVFQVLFTGFGAAYLFIASGLEPLLPWAVLLLALASLTFSRGRFPASH